MNHSLSMTHPNTSVCGSVRAGYGSCGCGNRVVMPQTIRRPYWDTRQSIETLEATGSVVTTLSSIGMTIVKGA